MHAPIFFYISLFPLETGERNFRFLFLLSKQSCRMSIFLHGAKPSSQILPEEKRVNRDHFGTKIDKGGTFGEQMLMFLSNYESLDRDISHRLCKSPPKKASFSKLCVLPNFYPNLPIFLHGYIRHIRDILQLCTTSPLGGFQLCLLGGPRAHNEWRGQPSVWIFTKCKN